MKAGRDKIAPKGRDMKAQGNALGTWIGKVVKP
jgi:hypothetical protein